MMAVLNPQIFAKKIQNFFFPGEDRGYDLP